MKRRISYISKSEMTRKGEEIVSHDFIILHEIGNEYSTLAICKKEIEKLSEQDNIYYSLHYIIDKYGNILQCIPENEISLSCRDIAINYHAISIGCIPCDEKGSFSKAEITSLQALLCDLSNQYNIRQENLLRHYDVVGKRCPHYYVEHPLKFWEIKKMMKN
ncbi:MAG: peptidoglycan recognition family protein [Clostridia bacterium]|nr:peptidoglycan recognition family protein [Clostridia bacterium]